MGGGKRYIDILTVNQIEAPLTDLSGTPGPGVVPTIRGRVAVPIGASSVAITCPLLTPAGTVVANVSNFPNAGFGNLDSTDTTTTPGVVTFFGTGVATAPVFIDFIIVN